MSTASHRISINASKEKVFAALTTADGIQHWFASEVEGDFGAGQEATCHFDDGQTFRWKTTGATPGSAVRWECLAGPGQSPGTTAAFRLSDKDMGKTSLECDHAGWPEGHEAFATCNTLWGVLLGRLRDYAEKP